MRGGSVARYTNTSGDRRLDQGGVKSIEGVERGGEFRCPRQQMFGKMGKYQRRWNTGGDGGEDGTDRSNGKRKGQRGEPV